MVYKTQSPKVQNTRIKKIMKDQSQKVKRSPGSQNLQDLNNDEKEVKNLLL